MAYGSLGWGFEMAVGQGMPGMEMSAGPAVADLAAANGTADTADTGRDLIAAADLAAVIAMADIGDADPAAVIAVVYIVNAG